MQILKTPRQLQQYRDSLEKSVGFVPTMGALHEGHCSLIRCSKEQNAHTIVSIYINPTQFLRGEDLDTYPKQLEDDIKLCQRYKVDALFVPSSLYGDDEVSIVAPQKRGYILEGHFRPGHFDGVLQVVLKLLNLARPHNAYFGKKDAQQYILIKQMVKDLFLNTRIIGCPTLRDSDGLAKSSRNLYLSDSERKKALTLSQTLFYMRDNIRLQNLEKLLANAKGFLEIDRLQYLQITDYALNPLRTYQKDNTLITIAAFVGKTRLIDNLWL